MMKRWRLAALMPCLMVGVWTGCDQFMYPTVSDVNTLADADRTYQDELHSGQISTLTDQHAAMAPELRAELDSLKAAYAELAGAASTKAGATAASGPDIAGFSVDGILNMLGLGWLIPFWSMFFGKSRAQEEVDELKTKMAVAAPAGSSFPGEKK